jgi:transcriptional regulator with XRE-family HTH domain
MERTVTELVANRVRRLRAELGWSAQRLADECAATGFPSLTRGTIAKIESGARKFVTADELRALARALRVSSADLLGDAPEHKVTSPPPDDSSVLAAHLETRPSTDAAALHLMIAIEHDALDTDRYLVSSWRQDDPEVWPPSRSETRVAEFDGLEEVVDEVVLEAEEAWAEHSNQVRLEFFLPRALLNLPVDQWRKELRSGDPRPLILDYPIVVRSLERMHARHWHRAWRVRWRALMEDQAAGVSIPPPESADKPHKLDALLSDPAKVSLVLSQPPGPEKVGQHDELLTALRHGLPLVVWSRSESSTHELGELMNRLTDDGRLLDLPERVRRERIAALTDDPDIRVEAIHDLVVLWDNPVRTVYLDQPPRPAKLLDSNEGEPGASDSVSA